MKIKIIYKTGVVSNHEILSIPYSQSPMSAVENWCGNMGMKLYEVKWEPVA